MKQYNAFYSESPVSQISWPLPCFTVQLLMQPIAATALAIHQTKPVILWDDP